MHQENCASLILEEVPSMCLSSPLKTKRSRSKQLRAIISSVVKMLTKFSANFSFRKLNQNKGMILAKVRVVAEMCRNYAMLAHKLKSY